MLQKIRDHIQGWIAGTIIAILAVAFFAWGIQYYITQGTGKGRAVAKVNGRKITEKDLETLYARIARQQQRATGSGTLSSEMQKQLKQYALQNLISKTALIQDADDAGFRVSLGEVQQLIASDPTFQVKGHFSKQRLMQIVYASNLTTQQFFKDLQSSLVINQVQAGIRASAFATPKELKHAYQLLKQTRQIGYFILPISRFSKEAVVSEKDTKNYYSQHAHQFMTPEKVKVSYIILSPKDIKQSVTVSEADMRQFYQGNVTNFTLPLRWKIQQWQLNVAADASSEQIKKAQQDIQQVAAQLKQGKSTESITKKFADVKTKTHWVTRNKLAGELASLVPALTINQISLPVKTSKGYEVVRLLAKQKSKQRSFDSVKAGIKKTLLQKKTEQIITKQGEQLASLTYTNPTNLTDAAKVLKLKIKSSDWMTRQGDKTGLFSNANVLAVIFSKNVLEQGNNSNPISLKNGDVIVVRVSDRKRSQRLAFDKVKEKIKQTLIKQIAERKAGVSAYRIQSSLAKGTNVDDIAQKNNIKWLTKTVKSPTDKTLPKAIVAAAYGLMLSKTEPSKSTTSVLLNNNQYAIIKLKAINKGDFSKSTTKQRLGISGQLTNYLGTLAYQFYVKSVMSRAKIKIEKQ